MVYFSLCSMLPPRAYIPGGMHPPQYFSRGDDNDKMIEKLSPLFYCFSYFLNYFCCTVAAFLYFLLFFTVIYRFTLFICSCTFVLLFFLAC